MAEDEATIVDIQAIADADGPQEIDELTGLPKVLKSYVIVKDPRVCVIPNFASDAEVDHILELAEAGWQPSVVGQYTNTIDETKQLRKQLPGRTSSSSVLQPAQTPIVKNFETRVAQLAGIDVDFLEPFNLVKYSPGQLYKKHHDGAFRPVTIFLYLSDLPPEEGGETHFPQLGLKIAPRKGSAVMWRNVLDGQQADLRTVHQGLPPKSLTKFGMNCFFNATRQRHDTRSDIAPVPDLVPRPDNEGAFRTVDALELEKEAGSAQPANGELCAFVILNDPEISVIPRFLSSEETRALIALTESSSQPSPRHEETVQQIQQRLAAIAGLPLSQLDGMHVSTWNLDDLPDGQCLEDGDYKRSSFDTKVVWIFLNDMTNGGELRFPRLALEFQPREGCAVVWPVPAESSPCTAHQHWRGHATGVRYGATCVFREEAS